MPAKKSDELIDAATVDALLVNAPALKPAGSLRWRERQPILATLQELQKRAAGKSSLTDAGVVADLLGTLDETLEKYAVDPDAYIAWALKSTPQQLMALFSRYGSEVAKLISSTG